MSKRSNVKLEGTVLSTRSTSVFKKVTDEYEYSECGLCFQSRENNSIVENKVAVGTVDETIDVYQKVVKIVELNEIEKLTITKSLLKKVLKSNQYEPIQVYLLIAALMALRNQNALFSWCIIATMFLTHVDFGLIINLIRSKFTSDEEFEELKRKAVELNMMDYINACNDKDDVSLYLTMPNGPFKNK